MVTNAKYLLLDRREMRADLKKIRNITLNLLSFINQLFEVRNLIPIVLLKLYFNTKILSVKSRVDSLVEDVNIYFVLKKEICKIRTGYGPSKPQT